MRATLLLACVLAVPATAAADVVELDGDALVGVAVTGISIGQVVTDKQFDSDDQDQREATVDRQNALGAAGTEIAVANAEALAAPPKLDDLLPETLAAIDNEDVRDLTEDALVQTQIVRQNALGVQLDLNYAAAAGAGLNLVETRSMDPGTLRTTLMELLPSSTGYQFELMK